MNNPRVESSHFPYLPITLEIGVQTTDELEALLDTGFDGDVVVPAGLIQGGQSPAGHLLWMLADGSEVLAPAYVGTVSIGGLGPFRAVITVLGDEPIVGRNLTNHLKVTLDHGQRLLVEQ